MPANWITERPTTQRRLPAQAPRLELPVPRPAFEHAQPEAEQAKQGERGAVVVDLYI
jgi:hypothetical protein